MKQWTRRLRRRTAAVAATLIVAATGLVGGGASTPALAGYGISQHYGVDACALQNNISLSTTFWYGTPYWNFGMYVGGIEAGCPTTSASFVTQLKNLGWSILPIWFGPQSACHLVPASHFISSNTTTAYNQGKAEAGLAYTAITNLGFDVRNAPITYDLEAYNTGNAGCNASAKEFIRGWTEQLHVAPAQIAGVYGSACSTNFNALATNSPPPDYITGATDDGNTHTSQMPCVSSGYWSHNQRHKQYNLDVRVPWDNRVHDVDEDCSNAPVYPGPNQLLSGSPCL